MVVDLTEMNRTFEGKPLLLLKTLWPRISLYPKQIEILSSVKENDETFVVAGNKLGKDFIGGILSLMGFLFPHVYLGPRLSNSQETRVITTSVKDDHLRVLWGEINRLIDSCSLPLKVEDGGPLITRFRDLGKVVNGKECRISYLRGMVSEKGEGMAGHHATYTLGVIDEASGVSDFVYSQMDTWAKRKLVIGNPNPCENFFRHAVENGNIDR